MTPCSYTTEIYQGDPEIGASYIILELTRSHYWQLVAEISTTRSKLKKAALLIIERYYRFRPKGNEVSKHLDAERRSHLKRQITRDNISNLLRDDMYQIDDDLVSGSCRSSVGHVC